MSYSNVSLELPGSPDLPNWRLEDILENISDGFFALDRDWRYTYLNCHAEALLKRSRRELLGKSAWDVFPELLNTPQYHKFCQAMNDRAELIFENYFWPTKQWFEVKLQPFEQGLRVYYHDITEHKQTEEALHESEKLLRSVINSTGVIVFATDKAGIFTLSEGNGLAKLGLVPGQVIGQSAYEVYKAYPVVQQCIQRALNGEAFQAINEVEGLAFEASFAPLHDLHGQIVGVLGVSVEITERVLLEEELREALANEKEVGELKNRFVSMVSHQLRTPLSIILSSAELLRSYSCRMTEERQQSHLRQIEEAVERMTKLLEDVLTIDRAEAGQLVLHLSRFNPIELCLELLQKLQQEENQTHRLVFENSWPEDYLIEADHKLLRQMLDNLLANALKFSPEGSEVRLQLAYEAGQINLSVIDRGIGIPSEDWPHLYEVFYRGKNVGAIPGAGLGLAGVKKMVELHDGTLSYQTELAVGTTFMLKLPISC